MREADGYIIIGSKLDSSQLERELKKEEKKLKDYEQEASNLVNQKAKLDIDTQKAQVELQNIENKVTEIKNKMSNIELNTPNKVSGAEYQLLSRELQEITPKYQQQKQKLEEINKVQEEINKKTKQNAKNQEIVKNRIGEIGQKIQAIKYLEYFNQNTEGIKNSISGIVKSIGKWSLALFGLRSVYSFIRQSVSTLSQYNEQIATDISYIRFALASTLQKTIENIIQLVYKLLMYINYIANAWFGVNLFANASTKAFEKNNKALSSSVKNAKELNKQLAGFDEMNVLQENGSVTSGGGGGGTPIVPPSYDLSNLEELKEVPSWLDKIAKNKEPILNFLKGLAIAIGAIKLASFVAKLIKFAKNLGLIATNGAAATTTLGKFFAAFGKVTVIAAGIYELVTYGLAAIDMFKSLNKYMDYLDANTFYKEMSSLSEVYQHQANAIDRLSNSIVVNTAINTLEPIFNLFGGSLKETTEKYKEFMHTVADKTAAVAAYYAIKDLETATKDFKNAQDEYLKASNDYENAIDRQIDAQKRLEEAQKNTTETGEELYNLISESPEKYKDLTYEQKETYKAYKELISANNDLEQQEKNLQTQSENLKNETYELALSKAQEEAKTGDATKAWNDYRETIIKAWREGKLSAEDAAKYLDIAMQNMDNKAKTVFAENIPSEIKEAFKTPKEVDELSKAVDTTFSKMPESIKNFFNTMIKWINKTIRGINKVKGYYLFGMEEPIKEVAYLRKGGIIVNRPSKGVMSSNGSAKYGESGAEGVIPLTDSQQMELLGEAIGRFITINATIPVTVGNRQIAREIKKIQAEDDFAYNR